MSLAKIARANISQVQSSMADQFDLLALTAYESFEQLLFTPIMDMPIPRLVLLPQDDAPHLICQSVGHDLMIEETHLSPSHVHSYSPYDISTAGDDGRTLEATVRDVVSGLESTYVGVDFAHTPQNDITLLEQLLTTSVTDCSDILRETFQSRQPAEIELIREAVSVAEAGVEAVLEQIEPGMTEYELASVAEREMTAAGARARPYDLHCTSGDHSLDPVRRLSHKPVETGDSLVLDFLPKVDHYFADIARTAVVGTEPTVAQREVHTTVLRALEHIEENLQPGLRACDVDTLLREFLAAEGYDGACLHHTGHAVGNDWGPRITSADETELTEGMVLAIEPGLYLEDVGGVRIEDDFVLTEDGAESLMTLSRDTIELSAYGG